MTTKIKTNKLVYKIDRRRFEERYDLFMVETSEKYMKGGAYILDAAAIDDRIKGICFESSRRVLLLLDHEEGNKRKLKQILSEIEDGDNLSIQNCDVEELDNRTLIQIMLNALPSYDSDFLRFNNLTGHLYCFHPEWLRHGKDKKEVIIWQVPCLEISVNRYDCLEMNVRTITSERLKSKITFKKKKFEEYPKYVFAKGNTLRRKLPGDTETGYILRQIDGRKTEIPFLDLQNEKKFEQCKVGMIEHICDTFNQKYEMIAHIGFDYADIEQRIDYTRKAARENHAKIKELIDSIGVHIVDRIGDQYSEIFCAEMKALLKIKYDVNASLGKRIEKDRLNICVIHNAEYYQGADDPHDRNYPGIAIQHITLENFADNAEFAIATVIHEVLIKRDLAIGTITLFDWKSLGFEDDISFGVETTINDENRYFFMRIHPDGSFKMEEQEFTLFEMNEYLDCVNVFEDAKTKREVVKGIIRGQDGNINAIKDTGLITLPEGSEIKTLLYAGDTRLRGKERREELLSSCLDIKTYKEGEKIFYSVGVIGEGMRWTIPRAANIRCIEGYQDGALMFDRILSTMSVTFVHNGQLTVLPFPYKYLREYIKGKREQ